MKVVDLRALTGAIDSGKTHEQRLPLFYWHWVGHIALFFNTKLSEYELPAIRTTRHGLLCARRLARRALGESGDSSHGYGRANYRGYADQDGPRSLLFRWRQSCSRRPR